MVRRVPGPACGAHGVTAMDIRPAELQNSRGPPRTPPVEDNGNLGDGSGVGIEEVAVQAGVGDLNQSFFKSGARLDGIDDQAPVRAAPAAPKLLSSGGSRGITGPVGMGDGR